MGWCTIDEADLQKLRDKIKSLQKEIDVLKKEKHKQKAQSLIERPKLHKKVKEHIPTFEESHNRPYPRKERYD